MLIHSLVGLDQIWDVLLLLPVSDFHDKGDFHHHHPKYCMLMVNHWSQIDGSCSDFDAVCLAIGIWDRLGVNLRCPCCIYQCHYCFLEWPFFFSSEVKSLHYKKKKCLIFKCFQVGETYFCLCSLEISHRNFLAGIGRFNR